MHLEHSFSVAAGMGETWRAMLDPERMARCVPGASLDSVRNGVAAGAIRVRLGAIGPTYRGTAQVVEKDDDGHRAVVQAQGGTRAHGDASIRMVVTLSEFGAATNVMLQTDLQLTGRVAELDTPVVAEAGERLCRQIAARLNDLLAPPRRATPEPPVVPEDEQEDGIVAVADEPPVELDDLAETDPAPNESADTEVQDHPDPDAPSTDGAALPADEAPTAAPADEPAAPEPPADAAPEPRRRPSPYPRPPERDADAARAAALTDSTPATAPARSIAPFAIVMVLLLIVRRRRRRRR